MGYILALQQPGQVRGRNRLAEQISLPKVAAVDEKLITLRNRLNPFCNRGDTETASETDDRANDGAIAIIGKLANRFYSSGARLRVGDRSVTI